MIQIGSRLPPVAGEPLEHLVACHDRILERLRTLERAGEALETDPAAALEAIASALRFLETSGKLHTQDEEESVFPRMRARLSQADRLYLDSLEAQHREKEHVYRALFDTVAALRQSPNAELVGRYRELAARLASLYRAHIESENTILAALGRNCLEEAELHAIHEEMKARRK